MGDLANEARLDAKAFRENTVYDSEGDPIRLTANADRLDAYAARITELEAENARLKTSIKLQDMLIDSLKADKAGLVEAGRVLSDAAASAIYGLPEMLERNALTDDEGMVAGISLALASFRAALELHGGGK